MKNHRVPRWIFRGLITVLILVLRGGTGWSEGTSPEKEWAQGLALYAKEDFLGALNIFQHLREEDPLSPLNPDLLFVQGQALRALQRWPEAGQAFAQAESHPFLGDYALYYEGEAWQAAGRNEEGLAAFQRLMDTHDESLWIPQARLKTAELSLKLNDYSHAAEICENFLKENPGEKSAGQALWLLGQAREGLDRWAEAGRTYQELWLKYPLHPYAPQGKTRLEEICREKEIVLEKIPPAALLNRAFSFYQAGLYDAALAEMERMTGFPGRTYPADYIGEVWIDDLYFHRAMCFFYLKQYARAAEAFRLIVAQSPHEEMVEKSFFFLIRALYRLDRKEEALKACGEWQKSFPQSAGLDRLLYLKTQIHEDQGATALAVSLYREIAEKYPASSFQSEASWRAGWLLFRANDFAGALEAWSLLRRTCKPDSRWLEKALYWRGKCLERIGRPEDAAESYGQLCRQFPASYYTRLVIHRGSSGLAKPSAQRDEVFLDDQPLPSFLDDASSDDYGSNPHLQKSRCLVRLGFLTKAAEELEAAEKEGNNVEGVRLEIARLYREGGDPYRSASLIRKNYPLPSLSENLSVNAKRLYLLSYPLGFTTRVQHYARKRKLDPALLTAVILEESRFNPLALSRAGARGLMQILPVTARQVAPADQLPGFSDAQLYEPETNLRLGSYYFAKLLEEFEGKETLALAAYNAGPRLVRQWMANAPGVQEDEFVETIPYPETRNYVLRVIGSAQVYRTLYRPL